MLRTETPSQLHADLDLYETEKLVGIFIDDQLLAVQAVQAARAQISAAVDAALPRLLKGGRLIYVGAGTSGRLGVLDSVELYPTFSWPRERALGLIAGGQPAMFESVEGAEDSPLRGAADIEACGAGADDVVLLIAASGNTPYVLGALLAAKVVHALTIGLANNVDAPLVTQTDIGITLDTGAELISGSTRLKAGTAQKIALNAFSSALMVRMNKVYGNLMVDLKASNAKLFRRSVHLTMLATGASEEQANAALEQCDLQVKIAIVMLRRQLDADAARAALEAVNGSVRAALR